MKTGIFYGSTTGVTEDIAKRVGVLLEADIIDASEIDRIDEYEFVILATSTWGMGELQDTWLESLDTLAGKNLSGKRIALIGIGDQIGFGDTFVDGIGTLYDVISDLGGEFVGHTSIEGYDFSGSTAVIDDEFIGLVIDENNQSELTDERIKNWIEKVR